MALHRRPKRFLLLGTSTALGVVVIGLLFPAISRAGRASLIDGKVRYEAAPGERNAVELLELGEGVIHVIDRKSGVIAGEGCTQPSPISAHCAFTGPLAGIRVILRDKADVVRSIVFLTAQVRRIRLQGGPGKDDLQGATQEAQAVGATILDGGRGADILRGSPGWDIVDYSSRRLGVRVTVGDGLANDGRPGEGDRVGDRIDVVRGGSGNDVLIGESDRDRLIGGGGQDSLRGRGGPDILRARDGASDVVAGGGGSDRARVDLALDVITSVEAFF